jgi:hypothetical protein
MLIGFLPIAEGVVVERSYYVTLGSSMKHGGDTATTSEDHYWELMKTKCGVETHRCCIEYIYLTRTCLGCPMLFAAVQLCCCSTVAAVQLCCCSIVAAVQLCCCSTVAAVLCAVTNPYFQNLYAGGQPSSSFCKVKSCTLCVLL